MFNLHSFTTRARLFYTLPPKTVARRLLERLKGEGQDRFTVEDVVEEQCSENKFLRSQRMINFLWRYEKMIQRHIPDWRIDFKDKKVLEIGGGPTLGFAPIAVFFGCARHVFVEPFYNEKIFDHPKVQQYFKDVHADLSALFGSQIDLSDYLRAMRENVFVYKKFLEDFDDESGFSVVLSNAVFEHIHDVPGALEKLRTQSVNNCAFMHLVNFGNHRTAHNQFGGMYTHTREEYWKKYGKSINLLRANDILACFQRAGLKTKMIPYVINPLQEEPNTWWRERYTKRDLELRVALFVNGE